MRMGRLAGKQRPIERHLDGVEDARPVGGKIAGEIVQEGFLAQRSPIVGPEDADRGRRRRKALGQRRVNLARIGRPRGITTHEGRRWLSRHGKRNVRGRKPLSFSRDGASRLRRGLSGRLSTSRSIDGSFTLGSFKLGANPAPKRLDFLCGPASACVLGDTETRSNRILKIHPRVYHRLC